MSGTMELRTLRLTLRRYRTEDARILYEKFGKDPEMYRYSGWNPYASEEMAENTVREFIGNYSDPFFFGWAIEYKGELIGTIGAYDYDPETGQIETGFSVAKDVWGHGFASEALACVLEYLCAQEGITNVTAWCAEDNTGSARVMEKAGMVHIRTETDSLEVCGKTYDRMIFSYPSFETKQEKTE